MREHDLELRKVGRDVVEAHRVRVLEPEPAAAAHAGADAAVAGVEERGQARFRDHLVERVDAPVVGEERLEFGWNLKPRTPWSEIRRRARSTASAPRAGSTLANGIRTSALARAASAISSFGIGADAAPGLPVDA